MFLYYLLSTYFKEKRYFKEKSWNVKNVGFCVKFRTKETSEVDAYFPFYVYMFYNSGFKLGKSWSRDHI